MHIRINRKNSMAVCKAGELIVEACLSLILNLILIGLVISLLLLIRNIEIPTITHHDVFRLQLRQLLTHSGSVRYKVESVTLEHNSQSFEIRKDGNRIIKEPGYEILMEEVDVFEVRDKSIKYCIQTKCYEV